MTGSGNAVAGVLAGIAAILLGGTAQAQPTLAAPGAPEVQVHAAAATADIRSGRDVYRQFREGLAQPDCAADTSARWRTHFAAAPKRLASGKDDLLPLFGYVVEALREANLPTEYALIPFIESGYKPGARSPLGPAGLWQMIAVTARNHQVPIRKGYDGRLSPIDSTRAAVRYLKTLHGMFAGDWRLAAMAYNAGEYRIFGALKRSGQVARAAIPEQLPGLSPITHAYVRKLHALSCLLLQAEDDEHWLRAIDRPVPQLKVVTLPQDVRQIDAWAAMAGQDPAQLRRLNPVLANRSSGATQVLVVATASMPVAPDARADAPPGRELEGNVVARDAHARRHVVTPGDSVSSIAKRYGVRIKGLLQRNGLTLRSIIRPGHVLHIDPQAPSRN